jgi:hypothetical protein
LKPQKLTNGAVLAGEALLAVAGAVDAHAVATAVCGASGGAVEAVEARAARALSIRAGGHTFTTPSTTAVVGAHCLGAISTTEASLALAHTTLHAASVEAAHVRAGLDRAAGADVAVITLAHLLEASTVVAALLGATRTTVLLRRRGITLRRGARHTGGDHECHHEAPRHDPRNSEEEFEN